MHVGIFAFVAAVGASGGCVQHRACAACTECRQQPARYAAAGRSVVGQMKSRCEATVASSGMLSAHKGVRCGKQRGGTPVRPRDARSLPRTAVVPWNAPSPPLPR